MGGAPENIGGASHAVPVDDDNIDDDRREGNTVDIP
jgi:hypothetical protein